MDLRGQTAREAYDGARTLFLGGCSILFFVVFGIADAPWGIIAANLALGAVFWTLLLVVHELGHAVVGALTGTVLQFDVGNGEAVIDTTIRGVRVVIRPIPLEGRVHAVVRGRRWWRARRAAVYAAGVAAEWLVVGVALLVLSEEAITRPSSAEIAPFTMLLFMTIVGTGFNLLPAVIVQDGFEMITDGLGVIESLTLSAEEAEELRRLAEPGAVIGALLDGDVAEAERLIDRADGTDPQMVAALRQLLPLARGELPAEGPPDWDDPSTGALFDKLRTGTAAALALKWQRTGGDLHGLLSWWQGFEADAPLLHLLLARQADRVGASAEGLARLDALLEREDLPPEFRPLVEIEAVWIAIRAGALDRLEALEARMRAFLDGGAAVLARPALGALLVERGQPEEALPLLDTPYAGELPADGARRFALVARGLEQLGRRGDADEVAAAARELDPTSPWLEPPPA